MPSESIGRGRAICDRCVFMQISPGSSYDALFIDASSLICNSVLRITPLCALMRVGDRHHVGLFEEHHQQAEADVEQRQQEESIAIAHHQRLTVHFVPDTPCLCSKSNTQK